MKNRGLSLRGLSPFFIDLSMLQTFELTRRSHAEFDETREARRRTSPRSRDGPERSEGFAAEGREQSLRARQFLRDSAQLIAYAFGQFGGTTMQTSLSD
jgi:hypothetical protein